MLEQALGRLGVELAIDLGTANTRIHARGKGFVVEIPSVVAVERTADGPQIVATGADAKRMLGRTPEHISAVSPIREGVVGDYSLVEELLRDALHQAIGARKMSRGRVLIAVPQATSDVERRAVQELARAMGARDVTLIGKAVAAAVGAELPIHEATGSVVVDIGAGVTEIAVLALGGVVDSTSIRIAGANLDGAITSWVRDHHNVLLGARAAEEVKLTIGCALPRAEAAVARITGRDLGSGIPRELSLSSDDLLRPIQATLQSVVEAVRQILSRTSPEVAGDIAELGLVLTGGTALLPGLAEWIRDQIGLSVVTADDPERATCRGAGALLQTPDILERLAL